MISKEEEILHMQLRLFRLACKKWGRDTDECADIFEDNDVDRYIKDSYEIFHVQGDDANLEEIKDYLGSGGIRV